MRPLFKVLEVYISYWKGGDKFYLQAVRIKIPSLPLFANERYFPLALVSFKRTASWQTLIC